MLPLPFQASQRTHQTTAFITSLLSNSRNTSAAWICFSGMLHWERFLYHPWHQCSIKTNWNEFWRNVCLCQITPYKTCEITAFPWANSLYPLKERETKQHLCSAAFLGLVVYYKTMTTWYVLPDCKFYQTSSSCTHNTWNYGTWAVCSWPNVSQEQTK